MSQTQGQGVPGIKALKSWNTLHQAMALNGGNAEALIKNVKRARQPMLLWYGSVNLLDVIGLIGGGQKLILDGPAIVEGERYGRLIHIETIGKRGTIE